MKPHFTFIYQPYWDTWRAFESVSRGELGSRFWPAPVINCTRGTDSLDELIREIINWHKKGACKE